jgi:hypothetical protein
VSDEENNTPGDRDARPSFEFEPEQLEPFRGTGYELIPLHAPDAKDKDGRSIGKAPCTGWRKREPPDLDEAKQLMREGRNVGVRLRPTDLVVDVDPRNFGAGENPVARLEADLGIKLEHWPQVVTGSGGAHYYMTIPEDSLLSETVEDYPGIEFKVHKRQVVAPGSSHPGTGKPYK